MRTRMLMFYFILSSLHMFIPLGVINILIPKVRTESAKKGPFNTGAQVFNNLPPNQRELTL